MLAAIAKVDRIIHEQDLAAPRFRLEAGETLIVDNLRMLHSREAYTTTPTTSANGE